MTFQVKTKAIAALLVAVLACSSVNAQDEAAPSPTYVRTLVVPEAAETQTRQFFGRVAARDTVDLAFEVGGELLILDAVEGAPVAAGAPIAALDLAPFERSVERAELSLRQAERDLDRARTLAQRNVASASAAETARTARDLADVALRDARAALEDAQLLAPFDGLIADRIAARNTIVEPGQSIVRLHDMSEVRVEFDLPERLSRQIGDLDEITFTALLPDGDQAFPLALREFRVETGPVGQSYTLSLAVSDGAAARLLPGQSVLVRAAVPNEDVRPVLPASAIATAPDGQAYVILVETDGSALVARQMPVAVAAPSGGALVVEGVPPGAEVVAVGAHAVPNGARLARYAGLIAGSE